MGRGTAILRFGSALHSRRFPGPSTQRLFRWLEAQLDMRGVDPALYSRYLISLLQLDDAEFERSEVSDHEFDAAGGDGDEASGGRRVGRKSKRRRQQQQPQPDCVSLASGVSSRKRAAAVRCLQSACSDPYEVDELIDELCYRLKRLNAGGSGGAAVGTFAESRRRQLPRLTEEDSGGGADVGDDDPTVPDVDGGCRAAADTGRSTDSLDLEGGEEGEDTGTAGMMKRAAAAGPDAETREAEDYGCAFPALSGQDEARAAAVPAAAAAAATAQQQTQSHQMAKQRQSRGSAWSRGPPRGLRATAATPADDEGFLEAEDDEEDDLLDDDDVASVTSEGSEILQLVSHILHSFNRELAAGFGDATPPPPGSPLPLPPTSATEDVWADDAAAAGPGRGRSDGDCDLVPALLMMTDEDAEVLSDHDFDDLPSQEEDPEVAAMGPVDDDERHRRQLLPPQPPPPPAPVVSMATGILTLPADLVLSGMANWTQLDRLRHQMWSRKPLPPKPQPRQMSAQQQQLHQELHQNRQPMTPLEKSKRACSFLLRGHCKKEDCEFAHDLGRVTCKFWSAGECYKGDTCPFMHGYPDEKDKSSTTEGDETE